MHINEGKDKLIYFPLFILFFIFIVPLPHWPHINPTSTPHRAQIDPPHFHCFPFNTTTTFLSFSSTKTTTTNRSFQIPLSNFLATFRILSNFFVREQLLATFRKTSTFLVTFALFWTKMLNNYLFLNKQVKILLVKILNIFLVKLIFLPFERVSCGCGN